VTRSVGESSEKETDNSGAPIWGFGEEEAQCSGVLHSSGAQLMVDGYDVLPLSKDG
jgi:hypothetical protein